MSWLLFMDECGHDHQQMRYEVHGGMAIHASKLWAFVQDAKRLELECFGCELSQYKKEIKGCKLGNRKRMKFGAQKSGLPRGSVADSAEQTSRRGLKTNRQLATNLPHTVKLAF